MEQQQQAKLAHLEADRDEARKEAQRKAVENSRLVGELEALKNQVKEQTAIIRGIASGATAITPREEATKLDTAVAPGPARVPRQRAAGEKKTSKKTE